MRPPYLVPALVLAASFGVAVSAAGSTGLDRDWADVPPTSPFAERGDLELRTIERGLEDFGVEPEHEPWGLRVCGVYQKTYPIFLEEDVLPLWLNVFHRVTRERVVARANTIAIGDTFDSRAYEDAERAIRDPAVFSVVAVVPVESEVPGCVEVLVVTRDVWSLKASWSLESNGSTLTSLYLGASENNLFGSADSLAFGVTRTLGSWDMGPTYVSRHFAGSRLTVFEAFTVGIDRELGSLEGTTNTFQLARPLWNTQARWAWAMTVAHDYGVRRRYTGATLNRWQYGSESVPERYMGRYIGGSARVTRAWGESYKVHLTPGFVATWRDYEAEPRDDSLSAEAIAAYEDARLPRSELAVGPSLGVDWFQNDYFRLVDYQSYATSEELRAGPLVGVEARLSEPAFGSDNRFLTVSTDLSWRLPMGSDAFVAAGVDHSVRVDGGVGDASVSGSLRLVTPRVFFGRIVARAVATELIRNGANTLLSVGGSSGLRGYADGYVKGTRALTANVEWRSRPFRIGRARFGGVASYDVGSAWEDGDFVEYYPSVGIGARAVFPATGTIVRAADLSFPLRPYTGPVFSAGLDQAF